MELPKMDKGDSQTILWNRTGIFEWKRRLRTNVGMVHVQLSRILPCSTVKQYLQYRFTLRKGTYCKTEQWQIHQDDNRKLVRKKCLYQGDVGKRENNERQGEFQERYKAVRLTSISIRKR